jgi:type IV pilus assembly protein PilA
LSLRIGSTSPELPLKALLLWPIYRVRTRHDGLDKEESHVLQLLRRRLQGEREDGFTLIELMVVVLIIAILIAIAIPTFLGARQRAQNRAAQSSLRNALTAAKTIYTDSQSYSSVSDTAMESVEPSLAYVAASATSGDQNTVSVYGNAGVFAAAAMSASGTCYWIKENVASGTTYGSTTTAANCTGNAANGGATATAWT